MQPRVSSLNSTRQIADRDSEWLQGLQAGRFDTYQAIFAHYTPLLVRFARLSVPLEAAEDIVQDVMFNLWELRATIDARDGLATYLFGAVRNRVINYARHEQIVRRTEDESIVSEPQPYGMGQEPPAPDSQAIANDIQAIFRQLLHRLSPIQREIITLRWEHEMSYEQIAAALQITPTAARQHGSRAQRIIRPLMERFLKGEGSSFPG
jgi:RNA polymerase sigma-70 factor (ECF subfamily)